MTRLSVCQLVDKYGKMSNYEVKKEDLRVNRTKKMLSEALINLLQKKRFSKINVNDICTDAMVSRAAFYTHFQDKYDLLRYSMNIIKCDFTSEKCSQPKREAILNLIDHIEAYRNVFEHLLFDDSNQELQSMFNDLFIEETLEEINRLDEQKLVPVMQRELIATFISGGITNLLIRWIGRKFSFTRNELAVMLERLSSPQEEMDKFILLAAPQTEEM